MISKTASEIYRAILFRLPYGSERTEAEQYKKIFNVDFTAILALKLLGSTEFRNLISPVIGCFLSLVGRPPIEEEVQSWIVNYRAGRLPMSNRYGQILRNSSDSDFLQDLYRRVLGRDCDAKGGSFWLEQLQTKSKIRSEIVLSFIESNEAKASLDAVSTMSRPHAILRLLDSTASQSINELRVYASQSVDDLLHSSFSIEKIYQASLQRYPLESEVQTIAMLVGKGVFTPYGLLNSLQTSIEYKVSVEPVLTIYNALLERIPEAPGIFYWAAMLRGDCSIETVVQEFLSSSEYSKLPQSTDSELFVSNLYQRILGRAADRGALDWATQSLLLGSETRQSITLNLLNASDGEIFRQQQLSKLNCKFVRQLSDSFSAKENQNQRLSLDYYKNPNGKKSFLLFGTCQSLMYANVFKLLADINCHFEHATDINLKSFSERIRSEPNFFDSFDLIIVETAVRYEVESVLNGHVSCAKKIIFFPTVRYLGFHPDMDYLSDGKGHFLPSATGNYHSRIIFTAYKSGATLNETHELFSMDLGSRLGYHRLREVFVPALINEFNGAGIDIGKLLRDYSERKVCFMHTIDHPKVFFFLDVCKLFLAKAGISFLDPEAIDIRDWFADSAYWLGSLAGDSQHGDFDFPCFYRSKVAGNSLVRHMSLNDFILESFDIYKAVSVRDYDSVIIKVSTEFEQVLIEELEQLRLGRIQETKVVLPRLRREAVASDQFGWNQSWKSCLQKPWSSLLNQSTELQISDGDLVASAGSCFASLLANGMKSYGLRYFISEPSAQSDSGSQTFSARYGNVYTARQLLQMMKRSIGLWKYDEPIWTRHDGRFVDPFRPREFVLGFSSVDELILEQSHHLKKVLEVFLVSDVFVFTIGLSEAVVNSSNGSVVPIAPEFICPSSDLVSRYKPKLFSFDDVYHDLEEFAFLLWSINSRARIVLTVSPVPLALSFFDDNAFVANCRSKSTLIAATRQLADRFKKIIYFPSYEIVTDQRFVKDNFESDLRRVAPNASSLVVDLFCKHLTKSEVTVSGGERSTQPIDLSISADVLLANDCDLEFINGHINLINR